MLKDEIYKAIGRTWFDCEVEGDRVIMTSREYGSVYDSEPGIEDLREAKRIAATLREAGFTVTIDRADEWVIIEITK